MKSKFIPLTFALLLGLSGCTFSMPDFLDNGSNEQADKPIDKTKPTCEIKLYLDDILKSSQTVEVGSVMAEEPQIDLISNETFTYTFVGWDANGDGVKETFPYTIISDTSFTLLYNKSYVNYHYDIYVNNELQKSVDAHYNDPIDYPDVSSFWVGQDPYIFVGWKYDGVFTGLRQNNITKSCRIDAAFATSQVLKAFKGNEIYAAYVEQNKQIDLSALFPNITASEGNIIKWYTDEFYQQSYTPGKMINGNLNLYARECPKSETTTPKYINNLNNLLFEFDCMILNRMQTQNFIINLNENLDDIVAYFNANSLSIYGFSYSLNLLAHELKISMDFEEIATTKSEVVHYTQVNSFNVPSFVSTRNSSFDDFKYKQRQTEFICDTSDALFYALEHGYKPIIQEENSSLRDLFNKMKTALKSCVDDSMDDVTKARKIYEYLILNTTYDYQVTTITENYSKYNSFYLEGVFNDNLAVCDGISKAYSALCNMEGIECYRVSGTTKSNIGHAWNKVKINNKYYVVDATAGGTIVNNKEYLNYSFFMLTDSQYSQHATEDGKYFSDYVANTEYDVYENIKVKISSVDHSLKASNRQEAADLLMYFKNNKVGAEKQSFDFELGYSYSNLTDEVDQIKTLAGITDELSFFAGLKGLTIIF